MKALLAIAAIILAAASFAGCSSGDDTGGTTGADNTTSQSTTDGGEDSAAQGPRNIEEIKAIACSLYKQAAEEKFSTAKNTLESEVREFLTTEYPSNELKQVASDWTTQIETLRAGTGGTTLKRAIKEVC